MGAVLGSEWHDVSIAVFVKDSDYIHDVVSLSTEVEELGNLLVLELLAIKLFNSVLVDDVSCWSRVKAMLVDSAILSVDIEVLLSFEKLWESDAASLLVIFNFKVSHHIMRIEVMLLKAEWSWDLTIVINIFSIEHLLEGLILHNVTNGILEITSLVGHLTIVIDEVT